MKPFKIKYDEIQQDVAGTAIQFPKYTTQLLNLANQNSQGTRPKVVGQMSDLIQEFPGKTYEEWVAWYTQKKPDAIVAASRRISQMVKALKQAITLIDEKMIRTWVTDLVMTKTFAGMRFQESILKRLSEHQNKPYLLASPAQESRGIDGYIGEQAVSIKPITYSQKKALMEGITAPIVFYEKKKDGIVVIADSI